MSQIHPPRYTISVALSPVPLQTEVGVVWVTGEAADRHYHWTFQTEDHRSRSGWLVENGLIPPAAFDNMLAEFVGEVQRRRAERARATT